MDIYALCLTDVFTVCVCVCQSNWLNSEFRHLVHTTISAAGFYLAEKRKHAKQIA